MSEERYNFRLRITGHVQGVGFRDWAVSEAHALGLNGWVRNRSDGTLEIHVAGPASIVQDFMGRCTQGPEAAQVEKIDVQRIDGAEPAPGFTRRASV